jgi:adenylate kinase
MINIVLFGPPGAGKGTQAQKLVEKYGFTHISTGAIIREEIEKGSELGCRVQESIERGELAPDEVVLGIVENHIEQHGDVPGNIFDGFPRTNVQAKEFDVILARHNLRVDLMLSLDVPDEELISRILLRAVESGRQDDAGIAVIKRRIEVYKAQTAIVANHYADQDKFIAIDGTGSVDEVFNRLCEAIDELAVN